MMIAGEDDVAAAHGEEEIEKLHLVITWLVKQKNEDKERLNDLLWGCWLEKERDKVDRDAMLDRMSQIVAMLRATDRR
ncbi:hypothetical protein HanRHA438_Chr15g0708801 [Helianthus annuus]|uniref:Uncharacterized protein n=1 Tax=Helianthus annuus TaxID=4232 RepID=A0A251T830_HELAN|nr:hypothetical protein HanXRQr2_Chr15g0696371 [Helianthus annuus]KAJ0455965.1 hypothetical protein HanIR_Chr15g0757041 [Helianthus annuus]KAJ0831540.1 hypothetical protein HanPSC8_Chr15g0668231 [Helianthus annuus]KAJ0845010.1 hypothetical protein HanRHA438_Chr15g0708801 [Helianthus annuus]